MDKELLDSLISNGFAIAVAAFLLVRLEKRIDELRQAIEGLRRCSVCKIDKDGE